jgi:2-haloacid dehalogenase
MRWVTFDCFGTLVDWHSGFRLMLAPIAGRKTLSLLEAYHRFERLMEAEKPHRLYKDVLASCLLRAANDVGIGLSESQALMLPVSWNQLPIFADVEPMLAALRASGYHLAVLTNCDDDLFEETERSFAQPFDLVITAERVRDYKPSLTHFRQFRDLAAPDAWTHVACSWYHDVAPTHQMGIPCIWLDRDQTGEDPNMASARVQAASDVPAAVASIL